MAKKCQVNATNSSSSEGRSAKDTTFVNAAVDIPGAENSRSPGASKHPLGIRLTKSGKYEARINFKKARIHLGTFSTIEEAANILNEKKLEYASLGSLRSGKLKKDASFRAEKSEPTVNSHNGVVLALPARKHEDIAKKSGNFSVQNTLEKFSMHQKCPLDFSSSSSEEAGTAEASPVTAVNREENHTGLKLTTLGKWGVQIRDPIKRSSAWSGTYSTIEEGKVIYDKRKLECESLRPAVIKKKNNSKGKGKSKRKLQKLVLEGITVCETKQGNWRACCKDPVSNATVVLGFHSTAEDAVKSYKDKKLKYESSYNSDSVEKDVPGSAFLGEEAVDGTCIPARNDVADACTPTQDVYPSAVTNITGPEHPGVEPRETYKWRVDIRHPKLKYSVSLGSYDTAEEAEEVYNKNKLALETVLHSDKSVCPGGDVLKQESIKEQLTDVASPAVVKYTGVKPSSSGRWTSQISNPFHRKGKVYLGTFKTAQEAADAFSRTRREFDAMASVVKKQRSEGNAEKHKKKKHQTESKSNDDRTRLFEILVVTESYHQTKTHGVCEAITTGRKDISPSFTLVGETSSVTVMSSQGSDNINGGEQTVRAEDEFGNDIIDSYGHLVGEYSRLDDELWLDVPEDGDEFDVFI